MQEKRLAKLEAGLEGREKVLAWLHATQQRGGFVDMATRRIETNGTAVALPDFEDVDSAFLFYCSRECNIRVLELQEARLQQGLLWLCVARFLRADHIPPNDLIELQAFRQALKIFVLQWMLLDRVVEILSQEHFSGMGVLYDDTAAILKKDLETAEILVAGFNVKIAPRLGIEPITAGELDACLLADAPKEADVIASHARAKAELDFGNRLAGYPLLAKVLRGYESKAKERFQQVAADYRASLMERGNHSYSDVHSAPRDAGGAEPRPNKGEHTMMICESLEGEVLYNDGQFAEIQTVGTEEIDKDLLLDTIQLHREDADDTPEEFQHRFPVGMWLDIRRTVEVRSPKSCTADRKERTDGLK